MKYICTVISVSDIEAAKKFYKDLFGLKIYQDYGKNIAFTCGLALQQDFDWLVNLPKEKVLKKSNNVEIAFEESDFDEFLIRLKQFENIEGLRTGRKRLVRLIESISTEALSADRSYDANDIPVYVISAGMEPIILP